MPHSKIPSAMYQTRRFLRAALGAAGAQAPCWGEVPGTAWHFTGCRSHAAAPLTYYRVEGWAAVEGGQCLTRNPYIRRTNQPPSRSLLEVAEERLSAETP